MARTSKADLEAALNSILATSVAYRSFGPATVAAEMALTARAALAGEWAGIARRAARVPPCAASMGCLCAGHARGNPADDACDTSE